MIAGLVIAHLCLTDPHPSQLMITLSLIAIVINGINGIISSVEPLRVKNWERIVFGFIGGGGLGLLLATLENMLLFTKA